MRSLSANFNRIPDRKDIGMKENTGMEGGGAGLWAKKGGTNGLLFVPGGQ
jgi:hypothetical protein